MPCPRCGHEADAATSCPRCGVVFAKLARGDARPAAAAPLSPSRPRPVASHAPRSGGGRLRTAGALALALAAAGGILAFRLVSGPPGPVPTSPAPDRVEPDLGPQADALPPPLPSLLPAPQVESPGPSSGESSPPAPPAGLSPADQAKVDALVSALQSRRPLSPGEAADALVLFDRHPGETALRPLVEAVLLSAADGERRARRYPAAADLLTRALRVHPGSRAVRTALLRVHLEASEWGQAESVAREAIAADPDDAEAWRGLGQALMRQDRNREAVEAFERSLALVDDPGTRQALAHVQKGLRDERGMSEKQLAYFHVRYDGGEHEAVGREMLRALERHYASLTTVFDHRPGAPIPVILFAQETYYDAAGAPRWSGGVFNHFDGRIRIPIGGLDASLSPDIDAVLVHEVTHAFLADLTRGTCPRDVHEGTAQFMEGKRVANVLSADHLRALADGRIGGVNGFYLGALAFVEHLVGQRGQGGLNELLRAMGETGDVDEAFRRVYGQDHAATARGFSQQFRRRYGS